MDLTKFDAAQLDCLCAFVTLNRIRSMRFSVVTTQGESTDLGVVLA